MTSVIDKILDPFNHTLINLHEDVQYQLTNASDRKETIPPVHCKVWRGGNNYEDVTFDQVYPFDTVDYLKYLLYDHYQSDSSFLPRFVFIGVPTKENASPSDKQTTYIASDFLWYPSEATDAELTYELKHPLRALVEPDTRFVSEEGSYLSPNYQVRGRSTLENVYLKPLQGEFPVFHVFCLRDIMRAYTGPKPISEEEWNRKFAPYFPNVSVKGPYEADAEDIEFGEKIKSFLEQRETSLDRVNDLLISNYPMAPLRLKGIRQLRLWWKKPIDGFEGSAELFYRLPVTKDRPYMRLYPVDGSPIAKLHVSGVIPIPTLDDPRILDGWGKETSYTPDRDLCTIKYIHTKARDGTAPYYGTIHVLNDGTMNLSILPPKTIRLLEPDRDFVRFTEQMNTVMNGLPHTIKEVELGEIAVVWGMSIDIRSKKFTASRLRERLPLFQTFFKEIKPLPGDQPLMALRYKAVSQYASENELFTFITQYSTDESYDGNEIAVTKLITDLQNEFQITRKEAIRAFTDWRDRQDAFTVQVPEEGEFMESYHPGTDIYIYGQHPIYNCHVNRIDSYETYIRVYTLLCLLMMEDDQYYTMHMGDDIQTMESLEDTVENVRLKEEENLSYGIKGKNVAPAMSMAVMNMFNENESEIEQPPVVMEAAKPAVSGKPKAFIKEDIPQKKIATTWFIDKLKQMDPALIAYSSKDGYSRKCQATKDRQPAVLSKDQYLQMRKIYENDDDLIWIEYPLEGDEDPYQPLGSEEVITVMRYGSRDNPILYYFCPEYFCANDEIMVRETDFQSDIDREGNPKEPDSCPFCGGRLITNRSVSMPGHTVFRRKPNETAGIPRPHLYIDVIYPSPHPDKYALPCCYLKQSTLRMTNPAFDHIRSRLQEDSIHRHYGDKYEKEEEKDNSSLADTDIYSDLLYPMEDAIPYARLFENIHREYILESNKTPIAGKFAAATRAVDSYFNQHSGETMVTRTTIQLRLRPYAQGFIRIGTPNPLYESLLGVMAPLLYKETISEVKQKLHDTVVPRIFLNSHFGNLVLEFYNPADSSAMPQTRNELMYWSSTHLGIAMNSSNAYALIRAYNSYIRFHRFIDDPYQRKDLRHVQPLLAEPGLFTTNGVQLIILDDHGDDQPLTIKCPTFGVSMHRNKRNDTVFITRTMKTWGQKQIPYAHYELYVHTSNRPAKGSQDDIHETIIRWDFKSRPFWPEIVRQRVDEFLEQCQSRYQTIYTSQSSEAHPVTFIPLSHVIDASMSLKPEGIVKDVYNHIAGVTYNVRSDSRQVVILPVVDDGIISISSAFSVKNIYLNWEGIPLAPLRVLIDFYENHIEPVFAMYPGYSIQYIVRHDRDQMVVAIQLSNGLYVPVKPTSSEEEIQEAMARYKMVSVKQFEWEINRDIAGYRKADITAWKPLLQRQTLEESCGTDPSIVRQSSMSEFEEVYQNFRLIVSNWITSSDAGSQIRKGIEEIIFNRNLPEYERRKRLYLYIGTELKRWFYLDPAKHWESNASSFIRKDCRVMDSSETCTGSCYWKEDEGRCLLHVHKTTDLTEMGHLVDTSELFVKRVLDELIRFPHRREQLMRRGKISAFSKQVQPIRIDDQYIIPESSMTWSNLLRLDWTRENPEKPMYYEEMSRMMNVQNKQAAPSVTWPLPLQPWFKDSTTLQWIAPDKKDPERPLLSIAGILGVTLEQLGLQETDKEIDSSHLIKYVYATSRGIGFIDLEKETSKQIQFFQPLMGTQNEVVLLVRLADHDYGVVGTKDGSPYLPVSSLPDTLQPYWEKATSIMFRKKKAPEPVSNLPPPPPARIPLVAQKASDGIMIPRLRKKTAAKPSTVAESQQGGRIPRRRFRK